MVVRTGSRLVSLAVPEPASLAVPERVSLARHAPSLPHLRAPAHCYSVRAHAHNSEREFLMPSLLHISASPRGARSESLAIARTFLDALRDRSSDIIIDTFDLWDGTLQSFGPHAAAAKMSVFAGQQPTGEEAAAWQAAQRMFRP